MDVHGAVDLPQRDPGPHQQEQARREDPQVDGLKTGFSRKSGFNIVATVRNADRRLIMVVLGSPEGRIRDGFAAEKLREYLTN